MPRKLAFIVNDAGFFVSHRLPIAKAAKENGYEIHVCTPADTDIEQLFKQEGFIFHAAPLKRGKSGLLNEFKYLLYLFKLYRLNDFDIIHHVTIKPVLFGGIAARLANAKAVVSAISGLGYIFIKQGLKAALVRKLVIMGYSFALNHNNSRVIFQNPDDKSTFLANNITQEQNIVMIKGSGVDVEHFLPKPLPKTPITITLPARMLWDKGVGEFVEAARIVKKQIPDVIFQLAGGVDTENPAAISEQQLKKWQEEGVIKWLGFCKDMAKIYQQSHIVCLPSYREGLPKALIEAMACSRAIITTNVPGCREVVDDGKSGMLVPVKNSDALAKAITLLAKDMKMLDEMGKKSREKAVRDFSLTQVINKTLKVYEDLQA